jgi:ParB family chromosome partitioning protein
MTTTTERRGLGRGLGELFLRTDVATKPDVAEPSTEPEPQSVDGSTFAEIPLDSITSNPKQPRTVFDEEAMAELVDSIREVGMLQPVVVRPLGNDRYELVMGERRWRAAQLAGQDAVPAIIRQTPDDNLLRDALLENLHRAQLNPLEEAAAYSQMLEDFGCTQEELSSRIKRSRSQISNTIRLLRLPPTVQRRVAAGVLSAGHARAILAIEDPGGQERLAQRVVAEGLSVRAVEELAVLGDTQTEERPSRRRPPRPVAPELDDLAAQLSDHLETRVRVDMAPRKGKLNSKGRIIIEFAGSDDLARLTGLMGLE